MTVLNFERVKAKGTVAERAKAFQDVVQSMIVGQPYFPGSTSEVVNNSANRRLLTESKIADKIMAELFKYCDDPEECRELFGVDVEITNTNEVNVSFFSKPGWVEYTVEGVIGHCSPDAEA